MMSRKLGWYVLAAGTLVLVAGLFLGACGKKASKVGGPGGGGGGGTGLLSGRLTLAASAGTPVAGATITTSTGATTTTNADGLFSLTLPAGQDVRIDATKANYTLNQVHVKLTSNENRTLTVGLMAAGNTEAVPVGAGGSVTDPSSNALITLPANFVTASGPVTVTITGLDPTTDQIAALPGGLQAVDGTGATKYLKPVSFAEYTARDASGNVLPFNSAASSGANIELPIPASLRGQPGYANGDPIECYVYDPADGKWKTPVPGVIGPSSVDGQPAIKATIFHLSWYGGAPASSDVACVQGSVRDSLGAPVAGATVEAFQGERGTTDAAGNFQLQAAANGQVRVVASRLVNGVFQSATDTVQTAGIGAPCVVSNLVMRSRQPSYDVMASMWATPPATGTDNVYFVQVDIELGVEGEGVPVDGATVEIGTGGTFVTVPGFGGGAYGIYSGTPGFETFVLDPGALYTLRLDYNHDGTPEATGQVRMAGLPVIDVPEAASVQPRTYTASWTDPGASQAGYNPVYFGFNSGSDDVTAPTSSFFLTTEDSRVIGSGITDPAYYFPDPMLASGPYQFSLMTLVGPLVGGGIPSLPTTPNIAGPGTSGYFNAYSINNAVDYTSTGAALAARHAHAPIAAAVKLRGARATEALIERYLGSRYTRSHMLEQVARAKRGGRGVGRVAGRFGR
jgi:hypothetical protein